MKVSGLFSSACTAAALCATTVLAQQASWATIPAIEPKGQHFFYSNNGSEFFIRGVAYQQNANTNATSSTNVTYQDPIGNVSSNCARDIPYLLELRTNVIRVYAVDPKQNHDECMSQLASAGIYVILDLGNPSQSINRDSPSWTTDLYSIYTSTIDAFQKYNNVIGFFAGNEVSNSYNTTAASAFVKAAVRDSKAYIKNSNYRTSMGVGYATYDGPIRDQLAEYFNCGDQSAAIDFWGYNVYSWCGQSSFTESGYDERTKFFSTYSVPVFFAEYGCNTVEPRVFTDVPVLYGPQMDGVFSGGIVYMYFQEENNYGLVSVSGNSVSTLTDFDNLSSQMASISPSSTDMSAYSPTNSPTNCPSVDSSTWLAQASPLPPTPNAALCNCEMGTLSCVSTDPDATSYGSDFGYVCGADPKACAGIAANATTGTYGAYGMCAAQQQLSYVFNKYYQDQNNNPSACAFSGRAGTTAAKSATGSCTALLSQAGTNGQGTVTSVPQGGSGSGSGSSSSSSGAATGLTIPAFDTGLLHMGIYIACAIGTGMGMILL